MVSRETLGKCRDGDKGALIGREGSTGNYLPLVRRGAASAAVTKSIGEVVHAVLEVEFLSFPEAGGRA